MQDRLSDLLDDALVLGEIQVARDDFTPELLPLDPLVATALDSAKAMARDGEVTLPNPSPSGAQVTGHPRLFGYALKGLVQTMVMLAARGTSLRFTEQATPDGHEMTLTAEGQALPAESMPDFFRIESTVRTRSPAEPLGLKPVVAERIVAIHGGSAALAAGGDGIVVLTISLPAATG